MYRPSTWPPWLCLIIAGVLHSAIATAQTATIPYLCPTTPVNSTTPPRCDSTAANRAANYCMHDFKLGPCQKDFDLISQCMGHWDISQNEAFGKPEVRDRYCCLCQDSEDKIRQPFTKCADCIMTMQNGIVANNTITSPWIDAEVLFDRFCASGFGVDLSSFFNLWYDVWTNWGVLADPDSRITGNLPPNTCSGFMVTSPYSTESSTEVSRASPVQRSPGDSIPPRLTLTRTSTTTTIITMPSFNASTLPSTDVTTLATIYQYPVPDIVSDYSRNAETAKGPLTPLPSDTVTATAVATGGPTSDTITTFTAAPASVDASISPPITQETSQGVLVTSNASDAKNIGTTTTTERPRLTGMALWRGDAGRNATVPNVTIILAMGGAAVMGAALLFAV